MNDSEKNTLKNEKHYDKVYGEINIQSILNKIENLEEFMAGATQTDTSWVGLYQDNFQSHNALVRTFRARTAWIFSSVTGIQANHLDFVFNVRFLKAARRPSCQQ